MAAVVQFATPTADVEANVKRGARLAAEAARAGARIVVLPETAFTPYCLKERFVDYAEPVPGPTTKAIGKLARDLGVFICYGLAERRGDAIFNTSVLTGPDGAVVAAHRKAHLYVADIEAGFGWGDRLTTVDTPLARVGMLVCADSHRIECARVFDLEGVEITTLPSVGVARRDAVDECIEHWRLMMRANAWFGRFYLLRADKVGEEGELIEIGHSMIIDPKGDVLVEGDMKEGFFVAELKPFTKAEYADKKRRPDLYGRLSEGVFAAPGP